MTSFVKLQSRSADIPRHEQRDAQVCSNGGLILVAKPLVDVLIHEGGLADSDISSKVRILAEIARNGGRTDPLSPRMITCYRSTSQREENVTKELQERAPSRVHDPWRERCAGDWRRGGAGTRDDGGMGKEDWTRLTTRDNPHDDSDAPNTAPGAPHRSGISDRRIHAPPQLPPPPLGLSRAEDGLGAGKRTAQAQAQAHWQAACAPARCPSPHHTRYPVRMAEPTWQETLRNRLVDRNAKESAYSTIIEQCTCPFPLPRAFPLLLSAVLISILSLACSSVC